MLKLMLKHKWNNYKNFYIDIFRIKETNTRTLYITTLSILVFYSYLKITIGTKGNLRVLYLSRELKDYSVHKMDLR